MKSNGHNSAPSSVISNETDLLLDGFPRSGNSFFTGLLSVSQGGKLKLADHLHASAHVKEAIKRKVPAIVVIRKPDDAAISYMAFDRGICFQDSIEDWISFYTAIKSLNTEDYVLADFQDIISDPNPIFRDFNQKFGDRLTLKETNYEQDKVAAREFLDDLSNRFFGRKNDARPSEERDRLKEKLNENLKDPANKSLIDEALSIYQDLSNVHSTTA